MSRKSKTSQPDPASASAQRPSRARPTARRNLFIASAAALVVAFVAAALFYKSEKAGSAAASAAKNQPALASTHSPKFGNPGARVHIVEFLDPACGTCAAFFPEVKKLLAQNPDRIRLSVRHVPFHPGADLVVKMIEAARNQDKYLPLLEALYASQNRWVVNHQVQPDEAWRAVTGLGLDLDRLKSDMNSPEVARRMAQDRDDAQTLGVTMTPEFFVNGRPLPSFGLSQLQDLVQDELGRSTP